MKELPVIQNFTNVTKMHKVKVDGSVIKFQERKDSTFALGEKALEATEQLSVHVMCTKAQAPLFNKTPLYIFKW